MATSANSFASPFWTCRHTWGASAYNTMWCLIGCTIGDFGTILFFQLNEIAWPGLAIMGLAMINGLATSVLLETAILIRRHLAPRAALKTALGMSFLSMLAMETAMNATDWLIAGGARLTPAAVVPALAAGFVTPWPYNYWRLKKYGKACH